MATIYFASLSGRDSDHDLYPLTRLLASFDQDIHNLHAKVDDPDCADIILFAYNNPPDPLSLILFNSTYRKYSQKCILFDSGDYPSPFIGGLYPSWPQLAFKHASPSVGWLYFHPNSAEPCISSISTNRNS